MMLNAMILSPAGGMCVQEDTMPSVLKCQFPDHSVQPLVINETQQLAEELCHNVTHMDHACNGEDDGNHRHTAACRVGCYGSCHAPP